MSGSAAKQQRREAKLREALLQAHDRLHRDDVDACHAVIHSALGVRDDQVVDSHEVAPLDGVVGFDEAFRRLCIEHHTRACYVVAVPADGGRAWLLSGGVGDLATFVDGAVRAAIAGEAP